MSLWRRVLRIETAVGVNGDRLRARQRLLAYLRTRKVPPDERQDFTPEEQARFERIRMTPGDLSADDAAWLERMAGDIDPELVALLDQLGDEDLEGVAAGRGFA